MEKRIERMRTTEKPTKARKLEARFSEPGVQRATRCCSIKGVSKSFGEKRAV